MKQIVDKLNKIAKKINENVELSDRDLIIDSLDSITKAYGGTPNDSTLIVDKLDDIYNNIAPAVSGNIEITENGENINVAPYATATVNVAGGGGFINPLIHFNISFENNVTECNMIWEPEPTIVFTTDFAFLVDDQNKLFTRPQLEVFFDSEFPFEWGISLISPYYQEGNSIWILAITASSETQEIKSVTSNDCQVMFNAPTFACAIPNGQSEATVNIVIGNTPK